MNTLALESQLDKTHIFRMTDDTGMFQHAKFGVPDLSKGYTTDDNARALIMAVMLYEKKLFGFNLPLFGVCIIFTK